MSENKLVFGPHFSEDGNIWIPVDRGAGIEFDLRSDGTLEVLAGVRHESFSRVLTITEVDSLRSFLNKLSQS